MHVLSGLTVLSRSNLSEVAQFGGQRLGEMEVWALEAFELPISCVSTDREIR